MTIENNDLNSPKKMGRPSKNQILDEISTELNQTKAHPQSTSNGKFFNKERYLQIKKALKRTAKLGMPNDFPKYTHYPYWASTLKPERISYLENLGYVKFLKKDGSEYKVPAGVDPIAKMQYYHILMMCSLEDKELIELIKLQERIARTKNELNKADGEELYTNQRMGSLKGESVNDTLNRKYNSNPVKSF